MTVYNYKPEEKVIAEICARLPWCDLETVVNCDGRVMLRDDFRDVHIRAYVQEGKWVYSIQIRVTSGFGITDLDEATSDLARLLNVERERFSAKVK